jgi:hypothetical protein
MIKRFVHKEDQIRMIIGWRAGLAGAGRAGLGAGRPGWRAAGRAGRTGGWRGAGGLARGGLARYLPVRAVTSSAAVEQRSRSSPTWAFVPRSGSNVGTR